jgi:hypothetical protein
MTTDKTEQVPQPADPPADGIVGDASEGADTEGHSMLNVELARAIGKDRARETEKFVRDGARERDAQSKRDGGLLKRFGRR